ncbi:hypothetical protein ANAEL_05953 [Anaerolineales bacterium]|nr:hypothetical protein ANAEL_05953 [Anaerolineales bacterium]
MLWKEITHHFISRITRFYLDGSSVRKIIHIFPSCLFDVAKDTSLKPVNFLYCGNQTTKIWQIRTYTSEERQNLLIRGTVMKPNSSDVGLVKWSK